MTTEHIKEALQKRYPDHFVVINIQRWSGPPTYWAGSATVAPDPDGASVMNITVYRNEPRDKTNFDGAATITTALAKALAISEP